MNAVSAQWSFLELLQFFGPRVLFAVICGGLIGLERELKNKPAGIKTNILICLGSALYTSVSVLLADTHASAGHFGDPARVAAQIVSGIGFLGGGGGAQHDVVAHTFEVKTLAPLFLHLPHGQLELAHRIRGGDHFVHNRSAFASQIGEVARLVFCAHRFIAGNARHLRADLVITRFGNIDEDCLCKSVSPLCRWVGKSA
jgi:hypothetical protein